MPVLLNYGGTSEEQIRCIIAERMRELESLKKARLGAEQAIYLAIALLGHDFTNPFWEAVLKLNQLRNKLAHNLQPEGVLERTREIARLLGKIDSHKEEKAQFEFALWSMFVILGSFIESASESSGSSAQSSETQS